MQETALSLARVVFSLAQCGPHFLAAALQSPRVSNRSLCQSQMAGIDALPLS